VFGKENIDIVGKDIFATKQVAGHAMPWSSSLDKFTMGFNGDNIHGSLRLDLIVGG
jgi:hypothetical protein